MKKRRKNGETKKLVATLPPTFSFYEQCSVTPTPFSPSPDSADGICGSPYNASRSQTPYTPRWNVGLASVALFTSKVGSGLAQIFQKAKADPHLEVAFYFGTLRFEWTPAALVAFVIASVFHIAVLSGGTGSMLVMQPLVGWTDKFILARIIAKVLSTKLVFAKESRSRTRRSSGNKYVDCFVFRRIAGYT